MPDQSPPAGTTAATTIDTPLGRLTLLAGPRGLRAVRFPGGARTPCDPSGTGTVGIETAAFLRAAAEQIREYFSGERRHFDLPLDPVGTPFQLAAWEVLRSIPFGTTITYGDQARRLGDARKARAAGGANGRNPLPIVIPCHRVIGSGGDLVGFGGGIDTKAWLLNHERALVERPRRTP